MATVLAHHPAPRRSFTPPPDAGPLGDATVRTGPTPIPNKHLPTCLPGPPSAPSNLTRPDTPPDSPPSRTPILQPLFALRAATTTRNRISKQPVVYGIGIDALDTVIADLSQQALPDPRLAFPWLHGAQTAAQMQRAGVNSFTDIISGAGNTQQPCHSSISSVQATSRCLRGLIIVKADGDLSTARLIGAVGPSEILSPTAPIVFLDHEVPDLCSIRNFHHQVAQMARLSDIVVYGDAAVSRKQVTKLACDIATAQKEWRSRFSSMHGRDMPGYHTFVLTDEFASFEKSHPHLVAVDTQGSITGEVLDLAERERHEMGVLSRPTEIAPSVWVGASPDPHSLLGSECQNLPQFDLYLEASDVAPLPTASDLRSIGEQTYISPQYLEVPSSGSIQPQGYPRSGTDPLTRLCRWIHGLASGKGAAPSSLLSIDTDIDADGDLDMHALQPRSRNILIHCADGYTETTLLALAYYMYVERLPLHEAWIRLHCSKKRDFFAYPTDVTLLSSLQARLVPQLATAEPCKGRLLSRQEPAWMSRMDGSLPSRILPYMYLGNLSHANNPEMLKEMGIGQILSVGEPVTWTTPQIEAWGISRRDKILHIDGVQDNGVDPLMGDIERCLDFIARGRTNNTATLVHCRVGVSRSATICIAEVMSSLNLSLARAYCLVRARRLNVIIQPHLRFVYELFQWDEICQRRRGQTPKREVEWAPLCREVARMNRPYTQ